MPNAYLYIIVVLIVAVVVLGIYLNVLFNEYMHVINELRQPYADIIHFRLYSYPLENNTFALYLVIMNPTDDPLNITVLFIKSSVFTVKAFKVLVPPHETVQVPLAIALINTTQNVIWYVEFTPTYLGCINCLINSVNVLLNKRVSITLRINDLINYSITINKVITNVTETTSLSEFGFATYLLNTTYLSLEFMNPSSSIIDVNGYSVYSYSGTELVSCNLTTLKVIRAMDIRIINLPTVSTKNVVCTQNYRFPMGIAQIPYGYVVLHTNVGNITVGLFPQEPPWWCIAYNVFCWPW
ncbi:hypothetical protein [Vulcanisaeta sp. JCM 16159]|uniref:hypothetical protein n=1 Tax=Vulcanisaeta sp. JCM 16159 TaxID=1295371 RepID=UPI0006D08A69|nr:hypothetical protein [Vulcanisaeta sp. JCM 16159]